MQRGQQRVRDSVLRLDILIEEISQRTIRDRGEPSSRMAAYQRNEIVAAPFNAVRGRHAGLRHLRKRHFALRMRADRALLVPSAPHRVSRFRDECGTSVSVLRVTIPRAISSGALRPRRRQGQALRLKLLANPAGPCNRLARARLPARSTPWRVSACDGVSPLIAAWLAGLHAQTPIRSANSSSAIRISRKDWHSAVFGAVLSPIPGAEGAQRSCPAGFMGRGGASVVRRDAAMNRTEGLKCQSLRRGYHLHRRQPLRLPQRPRLKPRARRRVKRPVLTRNNLVSSRCCNHPPEQQLLR